MRTLKIIGLSVVVLLVLLAGIGMLLPTAWDVERTITIAAPADRILPYLETPKQWPVWSAWNEEKYGKMDLTYGGPESGAGASWSWAGEKSGNGKLTITKSDVSSGIAYDLQFEDFPVIDGAMKLVPDGAGTKVVWVMKGNTGGDPLSRWFARFMGGMMEAELDEGLAKLKTKAESATAER